MLDPMLLTLAGSAFLATLLEGMAWLGSRLVARAESPIRRRIGWAVVMLLSLAGLPLAGLAVYLSGAFLLGQPSPEDRVLGDGVRYRREVFQEPRRIVLHILEVDLTRGHHLVVTPPALGLKNEANVATQALDALKADVVVNASFFAPFRELHPLDYSPHAGEPVQAIGTTIGQTQRYGLAVEDWVTFWSDPTGRVGWGDPPPEADAAVTGMSWLVRDGQAVEAGEEKPYPRTVLGLDADRHRLWLVVVDGKQPRYSLGMTLGEVGDYLLRLGAHDAIQLDGGGSATMAARDGSGHPVFFSRPCHTKIPGRQRPVANFLGVVFRR